MGKGTLSGRITFRKNSHKPSLSRPDDGSGEDGREAELGMARCGSTEVAGPVRVERAHGPRHAGEPLPERESFSICSKIARAAWKSFRAMATRMTSSGLAPSRSGK